MGYWGPVRVDSGPVGGGFREGDTFVLPYVPGAGLPLFSTDDDLHEPHSPPIRFALVQ